LLSSGGFSEPPASSFTNCFSVDSTDANRHDEKKNYDDDDEELTVVSCGERSEQKQNTNCIRCNNNRRKGPETKEPAKFSIYDAREKEHRVAKV
jgi:hypothetical protein